MTRIRCPDPRVNPASAVRLRPPCVASEWSERISVGRSRLSKDVGGEAFDGAGRGRRGSSGTAEPAEPTDSSEPVFLGSADRTYLMLRGVEGTRALDIQIGPAEAFAISAALEGKRWDRPMTHELLGDVIAALGATLRHVVITEHRKDDVFIAELELTDRDRRAVRVPTRPSDGVALALRIDAPILVNEALFGDAA